MSLSAKRIPVVRDKNNMSRCIIVTFGVYVKQGSDMNVRWEPFSGIQQRGGQLLRRRRLGRGHAGGCPEEPLTGGAVIGEVQHRRGLRRRTVAAEDGQRRGAAAVAGRDAPTVQQLLRQQVGRVVQRQIPAARAAASPPLPQRSKTAAFCRPPGQRTSSRPSSRARRSGRTGYGVMSTCSASGRRAASAQTQRRTPEACSSRSHRTARRWAR